MQVICKDTEEKPAGEEKQPEETAVSVQLFDSPPMNVSVPSDIPWTDPKFSEVVAQKALDRYKETSVWVSDRRENGRQSKSFGVHQGCISFFNSLSCRELDEMNEYEATASNWLA